MNVFKMSSSNIEVFINCKLQYKLKYHDRLPGVKLNNEYNCVGTAFHESMAEFLKSGKKELPELLSIFAEKSSKNSVQLNQYKEWIEYIKTWWTRFKMPNKIIDIEKEIDMVLPNGIPVIAYIDLIEELDDGSILIRDWKTGRVYDDERMDNNIQAPFYILLVKRLYPDKKINFVFDFIRYNELAYTYSNQDMIQFVNYIKGVYDGILSENENDVKSNIGSHCSFCGYYDYCPTVKMIKDNNHKSFSYTKDNDVETLVKHQHMLNGASKFITDELKRINDMILSQIDDNTETSEFKIKVVNNKYTNYDVNKVLKAFHNTPYISNVVTISKSGLEKYLDKIPISSRMDIEDSTSTKYSKPFLRITKKR